MINQIIRCKVNEVNGKHFVDVKSVHSKVKFEGYSLSFESPTGKPIFTETVNHAANANWEPLFVENEPHFRSVLNEITHAIIKPIFNKTPIQHFFQEQENCE